MHLKDKSGGGFLSPTARSEAEQAIRIQKIRDQEEWNRCSANKEVARMVKMKNSSENIRLQFIHSNLDKQLSTSLKMLNQETLAIKNALERDRSSNKGYRTRPRSNEPHHENVVLDIRPATTNIDAKDNRCKPIVRSSLDNDKGEVPLYNGKVKCVGLSYQRASISLDRKASRKISGINSIENKEALPQIQITVVEPSD